MTFPPTCHVCGSGIVTEEEKDRKTSLSRVSAIDILTNILGSDLNFLNAQVCSRCSHLLDSINSLQIQLKLKRSEISNLYENYKAQQVKRTDGKLQLESDRVNVNKLTIVSKKEDDSLSLLVSEPPKKKEKGLLTSEDLKCQVCSKTFEKRRYLMDHLRRVHNSAIYQCK